MDINQVIDRNKTNERLKVELICQDHNWRSSNEVNTNKTEAPTRREWTHERKKTLSVDCETLNKTNSDTILGSRKTNHVENVMWLFDKWLISAQKYRYSLTKEISAKREKQILIEKPITDKNTPH